MSSRASNIQHQLFEYPGDHSYLIYNITSRVEQPELLLPTGMKNWKSRIPIQEQSTRLMEKLSVLFRDS